MERNVIEIFIDILAGKDRYKAMASQRFNKPYDEVTDEERREVKTRFMKAIYGDGDSWCVSIPEA